MAQKTDLNVSPYYDDFDETDNFSRVLFRPGFAIQARELTQLQSTFQNQIEKFGSHVFAEGAMVIPGNTELNRNYYSLKLASTFASETVDPSQYFNSTTPVTLTGETSGVTAVVIGFDVATTTDQPTLYLRYLATGTDNVTAFFADGENISANSGITHTTSYSSNIASATTFTSSFSAAAGSSSANLISSTGPASRKGSALVIQAGVYYIRGMFVTCAEETFVLDKYSDIPSYRVGFTISETLVTPESDTTLLDNSTGSSNFAAKGAHRLQISLALSKLDRGSVADSTFVQLLDVKNGQIQSQVRTTEYSVLEETLARRTFDESGNYTVRPFQFSPKESVTTSVRNEEFVGAFTSGATTDDGNTASSDLLSLQVSPGKAYVGGFEIELIAPTFKDINKARDFDTVNAGVSTFDLGNFANITNVYGTPDVTFISGESTAFKTLELYDDTILTRGTARGDLIGVARARAIEYSSGAVGSTSSNDTSVFKLYMFDIRPFTKLTLSGIPSPTLIATHSDGGVLVTGNTSGATGFVFGSSTSGTTVNLTNVVGAFTSGEKLIASDSTETGGLIETVADADITISEIRINTFSDIRSVRMADADSGQDFTADFVTEPASGEEGSINLDGTDANGANAGDDVQVEDQTGGVEAIGREVISVARLKDAEKNRAMFKLPKKVIKTLLTATNSGSTDTQFTVRRQFIGTTNSSGVITFTAGSNETFTSFAEKDYTLSILTAGDGTGVQGDIVTLSGGKIAGTGTAAITITDDTILADSAKVKLFATILKTSVSQKTKTTNLMKQVKVLAGASDAFGTRPTDRSVSLGRADVFNLAAVFDSEDVSVDAAAPTLTIGTITGTFTRGEKITGSSSGATGRIISTSSPMSFVSTSNTNFNTSDIITGESSGASAEVSATTVGSDVITSRYTLDTGQRDNYYDIARIVRRPGSSAPTGRLLIIHDYLEHGSGDVMTVDSYTDIANQMDYEDIPTYSATKVDPDAPKPSGEFPLTDTYDFRPRVEDVAGTSTTLANIDEITGNSFDFFHRQYDGAGSSTVDVCQPGSSIQSDFEFHLSKIAVLSMNSSGDINIVEGVGAEEPITPKCPDSSMKLATIFLPAFTFKPTDVSIIREKNQRFTMRDIGELERRLDHVEYYTALNLLERDAESFEVTDANGLNRFKSGFVVDNFSGHRLGDTEHKDYRCAMDMQLGHLRPKHITKGLFLEESVSSDADRTLAGYQKTGDLITLPYTEEVFADQPYASRIEKVAPLLTAEWVGKIVLTPDSDEWFETEVAPELVVNVEGNFNAVTSAPENQVGTVWNAWQTQWSGVVGSSVQSFNSGSQFITRVATTSRTDLARTGMRTDVIEQIDRESQGFRVISRALIPILRSRTIAFSGTGFRPNTRLYVFFDKVNVNSFVTPLSDTYSTDTTVIAGSPLITTAVGKVEGNFEIPDPKIEGNLQFKTGELQFRLTSSSKNLTGSDASADTNSTADALADQLSTAGNAIYTAKGILETEQETIIATRNAIVSQTRVNQTTSTQSTSVSQSAVNIVVFDDAAAGNDGSNDPLAQTFIVQSDSNSSSSDGRFLTSIDIYFSNKDDTLPVTLEIRNVINGYPGQKILPFGRVVKDAVDINTSSTAATATKFTFTSPVYVQSGTEYCIALLTNSAEHKVWISRMGETDVGGSRTISEQPHTGVLFKSSNNSTWSPSQLEDLKFTIRTAKFSAGGSGTLTLQNNTLPVRTLKANSILLEDGSTVVKVKHVDHHMYSTSNNVTIDGVKSGASTTLNGSITAAATTLTLTSGTNFDDTTGKYSNDASSEWYIKIGDEIMKYTAISTNAVSGISRGQNSTTAAVHADGATVELYIIHRVPLTEINATHTSLANIGIDSYTISTTSSPVINGSTALVNSAISSTTALVVDGNRGTIEVGMTVTGTGISGSVTIATVTNQNTLVLSSAQSLSDNVVLTFTKGGVAEIGGSVITATENAIIDYAHTMVGALELPGTTISPSIRPTTATSAGGSQTSFSTLTAANARTIPLNDNYKFDLPHMACSSINETNELSGLKSLFVPITLTTSSTTISPVIDLQRVSLLAVANRLNNVDSSSDVYPTTEFFASTEPEGDNNSAIYLTKQIALENPATALKIIFAAHRPATSEIKVLYKLLRTDDASDFDDLSYRFFNTDGSPDQTVPASADNQDFREYVFTSGVTDDGLGEPLEEFIAFQIKIVMQGTNSAEPPRIKEFRSLALVT